ncbi:hypothetical protein GE09DRAFT_642321 [Coniochaeta sp. 2T2.1]|nr:hypothetical protein GE09DRAFT_642321 [Coniochaeta sp. 2T2.1]
MSTPSPRTLLGPLTTQWTAPPICSYAMALCDTCTTVWQGQTCNPVSNAHDFTDCWPPRSGDQASLDPGVMMGWGLYSPGIVCPAGHTTAAVATAGGIMGWGVEYSMLTGETAVACCPSGFSVSWVSASNTVAQTCVVTATSTSFGTVQCDSGTFVEFSSVTVPNTVSDRVLSSYVLFAPLYQLNFRASDVPAETTSAPEPTQETSTTPLTLPTTGIPSATSSLSSSSTSASPSAGAGRGGGEAPTGSPTSPPNPSTGLSTGAKAGIGVGVTLGAILFLALAIFLFRRSKRNNTSTSSFASPPPAGVMAVSEKRARRAQAELPSSEEVRELDGRPVVTELPTRLPSDRIPPDRKQRGTRFRRSEQGWVVSPVEAGGFEGGPGGGDAGLVVSPVEPRGREAVYELDGTTPRSTFEVGRI